MAIKCKYYINIHYLVNASWESSGNFMFWKSLNFTEYCTVSMLSLLMCTRHASHVTRVVTWITAVNRDAVRHNMLIIATYHRSVKQWKVFIDLESIVFSGSTRLLWIRVSPGSTVVVPALRVKMTFMRIKIDIHVEMALIFNTLISQSNFCIFHNTTQSVIIVICVASAPYNSLNSTKSTPKCPEYPTGKEDRDHGG